MKLTADLEISAKPAMGKLQSTVLETFKTYS